MKLLAALKKKPFCNDLHFFLIAVILLFLSIRYPYFFIGLGLYLVFIYKKIHLLFPVILLLCFISIEVFAISTKEIPVEEEYTCTVTEVTSKGYVIKYKNYKLMISDKTTTLLPGDILLCDLEIKEDSLKSYETDFDYALYLKSKGIDAQAKVISYEVLDKTLSLNRLKVIALRNLKESLSEETYSYVSAIVFAENDLEDALKDSYSSLGLSHILAISGLHIVLLFKVLSFISLKLFHSYKKTIPLVVLLLYCAFLGFLPSCMRAFLFLFIGAINEKGEVRYTKLDILSISFLLMVVFQPFQIYHTGFILSYIVSFVLLFIRELELSKNKLLNLFLNYILIVLATFPFVIQMNHKISILSLILSPILSVGIAYILLPISYLVAILPFLDVGFTYIFQFLNTYVLSLGSYDFSIRFPNFTIVRSVLYYGIYLFLFFCLTQKKYQIRSIAILSLYLILITQLHTLSPQHKITYIDVGQGDSTIIQLAHNQGVMVIDAYNSIDYIESLGISTIDVLILTHSDNDHIQNALELIDKFKVNQVYYPKYDDGFSSYPGVAIDYRNDFYLNDVYIDVLAPITNYKEKNSNSIVLRFELEGYSFLFCGDMTLEEENDIIKHTANRLSADVLKVGHHGSTTSTGESFLKLVNPTYSIISVGKDNRYGLPNVEVVRRLKKTSTVYQTSISGNIDIEIYHSKMRITPYR